MTVRVVRGDATDPPWDPSQFDLVFSNSVIEHVGGPDAMGRLAEVLRAAPRYFVQTPNRFFFVEPHFILPAHYLLPRWLKVAIVTRWDRGPRRRSRSEAQERVDSVHLLNLSEVRNLFPDGDVYKGRLYLYFVVLDSSGQQSDLQIRPLDIKVELKSYDSARRKDYGYDVQLVMIPGALAA